MILVLDEGKKVEVARWASSQWFIAEAPAVFVFFANPLRSAIKYGKRGAEPLKRQGLSLVFRTNPNTKKKY